MAVKQPITREELENNYEYKVTKRMVMREYPWILDIIPPSNEKINEYNLIFLDLVIDPYLLQKEMGWPIIYWVIKQTIWGDDKHLYRTPYLSALFNIDYREGQDAQDDIEHTMNQVSKSPAIPQDLKLPSTRTLTVGSYLVPNTDRLPVPDDVILTDR